MAREEIPMSIRRAIIEADTTTMNVTAFCHSHGVSTWFFWDLRRRYQTEGNQALQPKTRAPHQPAGRTPADIEDQIVRTRKELSDAGLDAGPATIWFHLQDLPGLPSQSTIWRILKARGMITAEPRKAPKASGRSFTAERANECWPLDDTGWELADGTRVKILNVLDDHSRLCVASTAMVTCTGAGALESLASAAVVYGWPERVWSDNAPAFKETLARALAAIGVASSQTRPYNPKGNGKVERFHQTLQKWLQKQPSAASIEVLQTQLDEFRRVYNTERPHRSLGRGFPADVWAKAAKSGPSSRPVDVHTVSYFNLVENGRVTGGICRFTVGGEFNQKRALVLVTGLECHIFVGGRLARSLSLTPGKRAYPLYDRSGSPARVGCEG